LTHRFAILSPVQCHPARAWLSGAPHEQCQLNRLKRAISLSLCPNLPNRDDPLASRDLNWGPHQSHASDYYLLSSVPACHAFCALQAITDSHSQKPAKPSVCRSSQRSTREATMCSKTNFDEPSAWPVGPQENTWQFWAPDTSCVWPAIIEVDGPRYGSSSEACLVSRVRTQSSAPILRSLAWSFAGSELSGTGPLTHMTRSARNHANLLLNLPQYSARLLVAREMPHRTMRYISLNVRRDTSRAIIGTRLCVASWGSSGQRVCARAPLRLRICSPILPRRGLYQRVSSHALHRPLHRDSLPCPEPRPR